ncbi:hypothetical protein SAMN05421767_1063 [Granulicatella balaenopterae]|uniref:Uncharacterized protein n=1 Tax=Granulicatella balaenopterae TaxID=137733 RepID=A0A1H9IJK3_9LACT|nr:hypothetical protein [Granulicatella balaenopterae]SEQ74575.1 hypothetical protein SAMN05421767_1063 [Granulicatella balaenopterae]
MAQTEAQKKASKKWEAKNREYKNYIVKRSTTRNFIKKSATLEDLEEIVQLVAERREVLEEQ